MGNRFAVVLRTSLSIQWKYPTSSSLMLTLLAQNAPQESMLSAALKWPAIPILIFGCGGLLLLSVLMLTVLLVASTRRRD